MSSVEGLNGMAWAGCALASLFVLNASRHTSSVLYCVIVSVIVKSVDFQLEISPKIRKPGDLLSDELATKHEAAIR
jgi:hypothetical protein